MKLNGWSNVFAVVAGPILALTPERQNEIIDFIMRAPPTELLRGALAFGFMVLCFLFRNPKFEEWLNGR